MGHLVYKCNRCDEKFQSIELSPDEADTVIMYHGCVGRIMSAEQAFNKTGVGSHNFHACADGGKGLADLIGWDKD